MRREYRMRRESRMEGRTTSRLTTTSSISLGVRVLPVSGWEEEDEEGVEDGGEDHQ